MDNFFYRTILLTALSLSSLLVFPQTKIGVYNGNPAQKENKIFAASLVKSFSNSELEYESSDETANINALLKQQGYKRKNKSVPDTVIATVCEKFEVDYMINFTLYPQKTSKNVSVSLINAKTFSVEKTKTLTCNNLQDKIKVKQLTDELAAFFLLKDVNIKPENAENEEDTIVVPNKKDKQGNLNGHYLSLGSSLSSLGYYGEMMGVAYEYRYRIFGFNASIGFAPGSWDFRNRVRLNVNAGCKFYLANRIRFVRNLYFNIEPFCYLGQEVSSIKKYYVMGDNYNIIRIIKYEYLPAFGPKIFLGYSPVWRVGKNKKVSLGFNIDVGYYLTFKPNSYYYKEDPLWRINWDLGLIVKLK